MLSSVEQYLSLNIPAAQNEGSIAETTYRAEETALQRSTKRKAATTRRVRVAEHHQVPPLTRCCSTVSKYSNDNAHLT
jgi:hypothetical protein